MVSFLLELAHEHVRRQTRFAQLLAEEQAHTPSQLHRRGGTAQSVIADWENGSLISIVSRMSQSIIVDGRREKEAV